MMYHLLFKKGIWLILGLGMVACAAISSPEEESDPTPEPTATNRQESATPLPALPLEASSLPDLGLAPDFANEVWLNTDVPLNLVALRGKVVLVEFWTFG